VVDGHVALAHRHRKLAHRIASRGVLRTVPRGTEELALVRIASELMTQHPKGAGAVAKALGRVLGGKTFDEVRAQRFVLAMQGVLG
jgi:hypothetical protein